MTEALFRPATKFVNDISNILAKNIPEDKIVPINLLTQKFYQFCMQEEISKHQLDEYAAIILDIYNNFLFERKRSVTKIRIFNPNLEENGWSSYNTIVEILNDDMPFLVDSFSEELNRRGLKIYQIYHPVVNIKRNDDNQIIDITSVDKETTKDAESIIHFQITHISDQDSIVQLEKAMLQIFESVRLAVSDWQKMVTKLDEIVVTIGQNGEETSEIVEFLNWIKNNNYIFLGFTEIDYTQNGLKLNEQTRLGVFKSDLMEIENLTPPQDGADLLYITKSASKSIVHRPVHMDYVIIHKFDGNKLLGEYRFMGIFTSNVYFQSATQIPIIRQKIEAIKNRSTFSRTGHNWKALTAILEDFPRDELFQFSEDILFEAAITIVSLSVRPQLKLFVRTDINERMVNCIVFVPRERMSTELRKKIEAILSYEFKGVISDYYTQITDSHLARIQIIVTTLPGNIPNYDVKKIEQHLAEISHLWTENLYDELLKRYPEIQAEKLYNKYKDAFGASYMNRFSGEDAYYDILQLEKVQNTGMTCFDLYNPVYLDMDTPDIIALKIYNPTSQISLSSIMPILDNLGLSTNDEHTYLVKPKSKYDGEIWIHRFRVSIPLLLANKLKTIKTNFESAIEQIYLGNSQNDSLNKLILFANLTWRQVSLLRSYIKYLHQCRFPYSQSYINEALCLHPEFVTLVLELFVARFDVNLSFNRSEKIKEINSNIEQYLNKITNLGEDKTVRGLLEVVNATIRTNYFQKDINGNYKEYISFKIDSGKISFLPKPKPFREIFVNSPRFKAIHLRGGKVARGGLRWSDRKEDFRTEVLGLMKAQMTKNSVIIPVGSKGGFVIKNPPQERDALFNEAVLCYKTFLRGLLDITDNIVAGKIVKPKDVICYDDDDPYLVVAADKGTATFSDYANDVSAEYNFWLGDAFASGGSAGYDHKKMAITAKGAWISVERHFREKGIDINHSQFSVVGIGDMSGDVFGNGMLLSKNIRLIGAFNHLHIFIDPSPDSEASFIERQRLFNLPRSNWTDYDSALISSGGGVFSRASKTIKLSSQIRDLFGIIAEECTPDELIRYLLLAPVDLLWNGGIGTYVKSKNETNEMVGDKANDALRVNGEELQAKIVGEGGNLGFTQLGRIEYALKGGCINTDAIDNSAGVDCSDHEVNIKIALGKAVEEGKLNKATRDKLLESMTEEISKLVLRDNYLQTQAISISQKHGLAIIETQARIINSLEKKGLLDRKIEFLPSNEELNNRIASGKGLTRPEISVVLAYSKISLYDELQESDLPDEEYFMKDLLSYFPERIRTNYKKEIEHHPLKREIIANIVTNSIVNRVGSAMYFHLKEDSGRDTSDVAKSYAATRDILDLRNTWLQIENLTGKISTDLQIDLFLKMRHLLEFVCLWLLRKYPTKIDIQKIVDSYADGIKEFSNNLNKILPQKQNLLFEQNIQSYIDKNIPRELSLILAGIDLISSACDVVYVANKSGLEVAEAGCIFFEVGQRFRFDCIREATSKIESSSYWDKLSIKTLINDLFDRQKEITLAVIKHNKLSNKNNLDSYLNQHVKQVERFDRFIEDLQWQENSNLAVILVALRKLSEI